MFSRILVPLDGSFAAERVLPWACDLALRARGALTLLRVVAHHELLRRPHDRLRQCTDALRYLEAVSARIEAGGVRAEGAVRIGEPARIIRRIAVSGAAGVIAMSFRGATAGYRALFGGTLHRVMHRAPQAFLLLNSAARFPESAPRVRRMLVPLDGSPLSEAVLPIAFRIAGWHEAQMLLLHVARSTRNPDLPARLEEICRRLGKDGVRASYWIAEGDPGEQILRAVRRRRVDWVAMNSVGRSGLAGMLYPSVAEHVAHGAGVPVLVTHSREPVELAELETSAEKIAV